MKKYFFLSLFSAALLADSSFYHDGQKVKLIPLKESRSINDAHDVKYYKNENSDQKVAIKAEVIFSLNENINEKYIASIYNLTNIKKLSQNIFIGSASSFDEAIAISAKMYEDKVVKFAHPNFVNKKSNRSFDPQDPLYPKSWHIRDTSSILGANINVKDAWNTTRGAGVKLAVYDDAVLDTHEDLVLNVVTKLDAVTFDSNSSPKTNEDTHGTFVAGLAIASSNDKGGLGVAPESSLVAIRGATSQDTTDADHIKVFNYIKENNISVMNNSWGGYNVSEGVKTSITDAIKNGRSGKGTVIIFAYGNDSCNDLSDTQCKKDGDGAEQGYLKNDESSIDEALTVVALNQKNEKSSYSNWGTKADIAAPGGDGTEISENSAGMISTKNINMTTSAYAEDDPDQVGTSYAAPVIAGVAALVISANPELTSEQVVQIIKDTADKVGNYTYTQGRSNETGYGKVNAQKAVAKAMELKNPTSSSSASSSSSTDAYSKTLTLKAEWNLISNPVDTTLEITTISSKFANSHIIWKYVNKQWQAFSNDNTVKSAISDANITTISSIEAGDGYWIKSNIEQNITFEANASYNIINNNKFLSVSSGWYLLGSGADINVSDLISSKQTIKSLWKWDSNTWKAYSPNNELNNILQTNGFGQLSEIKSGEGFWIYVN